MYAAAKGGVIAFTKTIAREMARHLITANRVCPGPTDTALLASAVGDSPKLREALIKAIPLRRLGSPPTWPTPSLSWPVTRPPSSPDRPSASAAA